MKVVAYCIKSDEKILLAKANGKKHDITLISNALNVDTVNYAEGKDAVVICNNDVVNSSLLQAFSSFGIRYIITRSIVNTNMAANALHDYRIRIISLTTHSVDLVKKEQKDTLEGMYSKTIQLLDHWQKNLDEIRL